jgi:hypothetical protein
VITQRDVWHQKYIIIVVVVVVVVCSSRYFPWTTGAPHHSHCSTSRTMCDVATISVCCSESIECFPGIAYRFVLKLFVTIPVAPIIIGIILHFSSTFAVSLYINCWILTSFPLPFVWNFCLPVLPHLSMWIPIIIIIIIITNCSWVVTRWQQSLHQYRQLSLSPSVLTPVQTAVTQYISPYTSTDSCHSVHQSLHQYRQLSPSTAVLTPVQTKQITINMHKPNNTKHSKHNYTYYQNTHTYIHPHFAKQVKTNTCHGMPQPNTTSHNSINKFTIMYMVLQVASVNRAILQHFFRQHWGGCRYRQLAATFKGFQLQWSRGLKHNVLLLWRRFTKSVRVGDSSAWISKTVRDSSQSCCCISPFHQDLGSKLRGYWFYTKTRR